MNKLKIVIIKVTYNTCWYWDKLGMEFDVENYLPNGLLDSGIPVYEVIHNDNKLHILKDDVKIIS